MRICWKAWSRSLGRRSWAMERTACPVFTGLRAMSRIDGMCRRISEARRLTTGKPTRTMGKPLPQSHRSSTSRTCRARFPQSASASRAAARCFPRSPSAAEGRTLGRPSRSSGCSGALRRPSHRRPARIVEQPQCTRECRVLPDEQASNRPHLRSSTSTPAFNRSSRSRLRV